jgi:hypothetical protein
MAQISDPRLLSLSRAVVIRFSALADNEIALPLRELLASAAAAGARAGRAKLI